MNIQRTLTMSLLSILFVFLLFAQPSLSFAVTLTEIAKLTDEDVMVGERFGRSVAIDGETIVVGAPRDDYGKGSAFVYELTNGTWSKQAKLVADDYGFGDKVAIDNDTVLVISFGYYAHVFVREDGFWKEQAKLQGSNRGDEEIGDLFGISAAIDGDTIVVGKIQDDVFDAHGSVYVFVREDDIWIEQAILKPSCPQTEEQSQPIFGASVTIDGDTIFVSGSRSECGSNIRAIQEYIRSDGIWHEKSKIYDLGMSSNDALKDNNAVFCGWDEDNIDAAYYVFERNDGIWTEQSNFKLSDASAARFCGNYSLDDNTFVVGASSYPYEADSAYVFKPIDGVWTEIAKLIPSDGEVGKEFAGSVSVDGDTVVAGARWDGDTVYVFYIPSIVSIDINPGKKTENVINFKKGKNLKVAIVGTADFDALQVDPSTVKFGPSEASPIRYKGKDYNKDGYSDLILTFRRDETGIACGDTEATLTGQTFPDPVINIAGSDTINVEPCP